jgi:general secretion pathway protein C
MPAAGASAAAALLFGPVKRDANIAAPTDAAMKLLGVAAGSQHTRGYAVLQLGGKDIVAIREGADIVTGIRLAEVHRDRIILDRNGTRETLEWPRQIIAAAPAIPRPGIAPSVTAPAASTLAGAPPSPAAVGPPPSKADRDRLSD